MFNFTIRRSSQAISQINCDLMSGFVLVTYKNGSTYGYTNVSKRAILQLWIDYAYTKETISLGFWVNRHCVNKCRGKYAEIPASMVKSLAFA